MEGSVAIGTRHVQHAIASAVTPASLSVRLALQDHVVPEAGGAHAASCEMFAAKVVVLCSAYLQSAMTSSEEQPSA